MNDAELPTSWSDLLQDGLSARSVEQFIASQLSSTQAFLQGKDTPPPAPPLINAPHSSPDPARRSPLPATSLLHAGCSDPIRRPTSVSPTSPRKREFVPPTHRGLSEQLSSMSHQTSHSPSGVQTPNLSRSSSFVDRGEMHSAATSSVIPALTREELGRQVQRLQAQLARATQERGVEVLSLRRELDDARVLDEEFEATRRSMEAAHAAAEAAKEAKMQAELASKQFTMEKRSESERALLAERRAEQAEVAREQAEVAREQANAAVEALRGTCDLLISARDEEVRGAAYERAQAMVEMEVMRKVVCEMEEGIEDSRATSLSHAAEACAVEQALLSEMMQREEKTERRASQLHEHVLELERMLEEQHMQASVTAEQTASHGEALGEQVATLTKTCRSLEGEREELMNELAATLELVERLKSTLEEQGASYSELQRSADSRSFELTSLRAENTLALDEMRGLESSFIALQPLLSELTESHETALVVASEQHATIVSQLVEIVRALSSCLDSIPSKVCQLLSESSYGANAARSARELSGEICSQLQWTREALPWAANSVESISELRPILLDASVTQANLALKTISHGFECASDTLSIASLELERHSADFAAFLEQEGEARRVVVNSLATDLRDGEHLVAKAAAETCGNSCSIAVLKNEVGAFELELHEERVRCAAAEKQCRVVRLERDEAVASEQEAHATIDSLSESLEVSRAEVLSLKQDLVEHGLEGHANDRHMSRALSEVEELQVYPSLLFAELAAAEEAFSAERAGVAALQRSLERCDLELTHLGRSRDELESVIRELHASRAGLETERDAAEARAVSMAEEARRWSARAYASDALRGVAVRQREGREEELRACVVVARGECEVLIREIETQEATARELEAIVRAGGQGGGGRERWEGAEVAAAEVEVSEVHTKLMELSLQLQDDLDEVRSSPSPLAANRPPLSSRELEDSGDRRKSALPVEAPHTNTCIPVVTPISSPLRKSWASEAPPFYNAQGSALSMSHPQRDKFAENDPLQEGWASSRSTPLPAHPEFRQQPNEWQSHDRYSGGRPSYEALAQQLAASPCIFQPSENSTVATSPWTCGASSSHVGSRRNLSATQHGRFSSTSRYRK